MSDRIIANRTTAPRRYIAFDAHRKEPGHEH